MICCICGKPEKITTIGGVRLSNMAQYSWACADCVNKEMKKVSAEEERARRHNSRR